MLYFSNKLENNFIIVTNMTIFKGLKGSLLWHLENTS